MVFIVILLAACLLGTAPAVGFSLLNDPDYTKQAFNIDFSYIGNDFMSTTLLNIIERIGFFSRPDWTDTLKTDERAPFEATIMAEDKTLPDDKHRERLDNKCVVNHGKDINKFYACVFSPKEQGNYYAQVILYSTGDGGAQIEHYVKWVDNRQNERLDRRKMNATIQTPFAPSVTLLKTHLDKDDEFNVVLLKRKGFAANNFLFGWIVMWRATDQESGVKEFPRTWGKRIHNWSVREQYYRYRKDLHRSIQYNKIPLETKWKAITDAAKRLAQIAVSKEEDKGLKLVFMATVFAEDWALSLDDRDRLDNKCDVIVGNRSVGDDYACVFKAEEEGYYRTQHIIDGDADGNVTIQYFAGEHQSMREWKVYQTRNIVSVEYEVIYLKEGEKLFSRMVGNQMYLDLRFAWLSVWKIDSSDNFLRL